MNRRCGQRCCTSLCTQHAKGRSQGRNRPLSWRARRDSNPNLLIRRSMEGVRPVRRNPYPQVKILLGVRRWLHGPVPSGQCVRKL
jgi:hypothetical protein